MAASPGNNQSLINVDALIQRTQRLRGLIKFATRAFVLEFGGTPKAGKSTAVEAISHFFRRNDFRVHVLRERASFCPIPMKGHLFFNTWCSGTMLAELLENIETPTDIIIKDRGLFDALVWLQAQYSRGEVTDEERTAIENFLLLDRWRNLVDIVALFTVSPNQALQREDADHITPQKGTIMDTEILAAINDSALSARDRYSSKFKNFLHIDTTDSTPKKTNLDVASKILDVLEPFVDPEIVVVQREILESLEMDRGGCFRSEAVANALVTINANRRNVRRSLAETSDEFVQIIPCGVLVSDGKVFTLNRKEADPKYHLYGQTTIWQGCHLLTDAPGVAAGRYDEALRCRIADSLYLSRSFSISPIG